jgi:hypothetical protein
MKKISICGTLLALTYGDKEVLMKLAYIFSAALLVFSFNLQAEQTPAKSAEEELPIVEFETKKQVQIEDETLLKKKKKQGNQLVLSDSASADLNLSVVIAKKSKAKSSEQVQEEDFSRLDRELEVLK